MTRVIKPPCEYKDITSSCIPREVGAEPIILSGIWLGVSFTMFHVEVKGRISESKQFKGIRSKY